MANTDFWLISIESSRLTVSLVQSDQSTYQLKSTGSPASFSTDDPASFAEAIDTSLSAAAATVALDAEQEPSSCAFILPPSWIDPNGQIVSLYLNLIKTACNQLQLKPLGFIANDEAVAEAINQQDGFPSGFVLVNFGQNHLSLSLIYLGKVKKRSRQPLPSTFHPSLIETMLLDLKQDSAIPPQIVITGNFSNEMEQAISSYSWVGKNKPETFLHLPQVIAITPDQLLKFYYQTIISQIDPQASLESISLPTPSTETDTEPSSPEIEPEAESSLEETDAATLGFSDSASSPQSTPDLPLLQSSVDPGPPPPQPKPKLKPKLKLKLPSFSWPKFKFSFRWLFFAVALLPLLVLVPFFLSTATITLFVTPVALDKQIPATLDTSLTSAQQSVFPAQKHDFSFDLNQTIATTGTKTIGQKAKGEIKIYNKQSQPQTLPQGTILLDSQNRQYELLVDVNVASSSSDLEQGIITLGQAKTVVEAVDIGPEYNIGADSQLTFKDHSVNQVIAKVASGLNGGSRQTVEAVSEADRSLLKDQIDQQLSQFLQDNIQQETDKIGHIIPSTINSQTSRIDYSREVGEPASELTGSVSVSASVFSLPPSFQKTIIASVFQDQPDFDPDQIDLANFTISFDSTDLNSTTATGNLTVSGWQLPTIDSEQIKQQLSGKSHSKAQQIITQNIPRAYNYHITTNLSFLDFINPLPFNAKNIKLDIKTESL